MLQVWTGWTLCQLLSQQGCLYHSRGRSQALSVNRGQVNHVEAEAEPGEPENLEEVPVEGEEANEEGIEQQD